MATWKKVLTEEDGNLATSDLTSTSTTRVFKFASGNSGLFFQSNAGDTVFGMFTFTNGFSTTSLYGGMQIVEDSSGQQACLKLFSSNVSSDYVCLMANSSATADQNLFFPAGLPSANQVLQVNSVSGSDVNLEWASASGGVTINNNTDNYLLTASGTANTVNGEGNLTFDGSVMEVSGKIEYQPEANVRYGEYYDGSDVGPYLGSSGNSAGDLMGFTKAGSVTAFKVHTMSAAAGAPELLDASSSSTNINQIAGITVITASATPGSRDFYVRGMVTIPQSAVNGTFSSSYGDPLYLDPSSAGVLTLTPPTTSSTYRRQMGYLINAVTISSVNHYIIWFDPSPEYVKIV